MLITGARVANDAGTAVRRNLWLHGDSISFTPIRDAEISRLDLEGFLVLPGLINAHDHLEMNLFPRLGNGPYANACRWAEDIHHPWESPVKQHLAVPKTPRLIWGAIKNLLSGVTTVAHHNAPHPILFEKSFPIRVLKRYNWAHSLRFSPDWLSRFQATPAGHPFIIHAAEGTDESAQREIHAMDRAGALSQATVLVHGVAIGLSDVPLISARRASLIWCPSSNHFTLGRSLESSVLESGIPIALGTDSAMTADGDLLDELRVAHRTIGAERLFQMVTSEPARILKLPVGFGHICDGGPADLLVLRDEGKTPADTLLWEHPQLVIAKGRAVLASSTFAESHPFVELRHLFPVQLEARARYWIAPNVPRLMRETKKVLHDELRLAGKAVAA